jgi:hypothetical protein
MTNEEERKYELRANFRIVNPGTSANVQPLSFMCPPANNLEIETELLEL